MATQLTEGLEVGALRTDARQARGACVRGRGCTQTAESEARSTIVGGRTGDRASTHLVGALVGFLVGGGGLVVGASVNPAVFAHAAALQEACCL